MVLVPGLSSVLSLRIAGKAGCLQGWRDRAMVNDEETAEQASDSSITSASIPRGLAVDSAEQGEITRSCCCSKLASSCCGFLPRLSWIPVHVSCATETVQDLPPGLVSVFERNGQSQLLGRMYRGAINSLILSSWLHGYCRDLAVNPLKDGVTGRPLKAYWNPSLLYSGPPKSSRRGEPSVSRSGLQGTRCVGEVSR